MSRKLVSIIYDRRCGSMLRKAVLACMADRANDDGSGVWMSKGRIADEVEASRRAVITCIQALVEDGLLFDQGKRYRSTFDQYEINVRALLSLPRSYLGGVQNFTPASQQSVQNLHTGCERSSHHL
jgi:biotin operon repressor